MVFRARWKEFTKAGWTSKKPAGLSVNTPTSSTWQWRRREEWSAEPTRTRLLLRTDKPKAMAPTKRLRRIKQVASTTAREMMLTKPNKAKLLANRSSQPLPTLKTLNLVHEAMSRTLDRMLRTPSLLSRKVRVPQVSAATALPIWSLRLLISGPRPAATCQALHDRLHQQPLLLKRQREIFARSLASAMHLIASEYEPSGSDEEELEEESKEESEMNEDDEETKEDTPVSVDDPNIMQPGEVVDDYTVLDSDGENGTTSVFGDDEELALTEPAAEVAASASDLHFNPSLLETVGGLSEIAHGSVPKDVLADMKFNGWTELTNVIPYPYMHQPYNARPDGWIKEAYQTSMKENMDLQPMQLLRH
ncbi:hypothetical protein PHYSODRAFT_259147 [Phytophthora sojae]|uniref:Uncharacterized protein n=1 Tax=Phytophthora sojae (strain P6497) TaxID=1094619 RepID=G4ZSA3_PHYSP|nr:hypothetical protein PHYSODRAFT_259147 [Phytophthora sojae]EGZ12999.1 hypothetical protein PHYSODRAFT_259147 [Phytophthora sojae]|eukprot:XP_009530428.1 hypothetical protein PHYSODRAFT_259147 [Phytophthora sojae]